MKKLQTVILLLAVLCLLAGCRSSTWMEDAKNAMGFGLSGAHEYYSQQTEAAEATKPTGDTYEGILYEDLEVVESYISTYGFTGDSERDEKGIYYTYEGGVMRMPATVMTQLFFERGIGFLLFLDGKPQPYYTSEDSTLRYMHTVYPMKAIKNFDIFFIPVAGQAGDTLELCLLALTCPDYCPAVEMIPFWDTAADRPVFQRLIFEATPPEQTLPQVQDRLIEWTASYGYTYISAKDRLGLDKECLYTMELNGMGDDGTVYNVTPDEPLTVRLELTGTPQVEYGIVIFYDHQPISVAPEDILTMQAPSDPAGDGEATCILEAKVDVSDFDGEALIYAVLVPKNMRATNAVYMSNYFAYHFAVGVQSFDAWRIWRYRQ